MTSARANDAPEAQGAREAVLERIRAALADRPAPVAIPRAYETAAGASIDIAALFVDGVADYRATIERTTADYQPAAVAATFSAQARVGSPPQPGCRRPGSPQPAWSACRMRRP